MVETWPHTLSMASAVVDEVRRVGGVPLMFLEDETAYWSAVDRKQTRLLGTMGAPEQAALKEADVYVMFWGPGDSARFNQLDLKTSDEVTAWNDPWYAIVRTTGLRGVRMALGFATESNARAWGTTLDRLTRRILEASSADPRSMARDGARLQRSLRGRPRVQIRHPNGTDLEVALAGVPSKLHTGIPGRHSAVDPYGMLSGNPEGRLPVALDGSTAEGTIVANLPTWTPWWSNSGGRLEFHEGRLTEFSFEEGEGSFRERYAQGTAGKDRAGALAFGLNPLLKDVPSMHVSERGVVSLQVGRNTGFGGTNDSSFMDWVSVAGAEVSVDGTPLLRRGRIL